jgi:triosephosphate isomerase
MHEKRLLIAGNWKMNGVRSDLAEIDCLAGERKLLRRQVTLAVFPPATLLSAACERARGSGLLVGGQDCHPQSKGAFTGDISAEMLADAGATHVIVGHSERRTLHGETDALVHAKLQAAWRAGLVAILCVGEREEERTSGITLEVVRRQIAEAVHVAADPARLVIAYEPVWAIGSGRTPRTDEIEEVHASVRSILSDAIPGGGQSVPILYGGSVKPDNAASILALINVDGALVGGASLSAKSLLAIASSLN